MDSLLICARPRPRVVLVEVTPREQVGQFTAHLVQIVITGPHPLDGEDRSASNVVKSTMISRSGMRGTTDADPPPRGILLLAHLTPEPYHDVGDQDTKYSVAYRLRGSSS